MKKKPQEQPAPFSLQDAHRNINAIPDETFPAVVPDGADPALMQRQVGAEPAVIDPAAMAAPEGLGVAEQGPVDPNDEEPGADLETKKDLEERAKDTPSFLSA